MSSVGICTWNGVGLYMTGGLSAMYPGPSVDSVQCQQIRGAEGEKSKKIAFWQELILSIDLML
jgi:hypothetical protein